MVEGLVRESGKFVGWVVRRGIYPFFFLGTIRSLRGEMAVGVLVVGVEEGKVLVVRVWR